MRIRARFYAWSRGISYDDACAAVDTVDLVRYLFQWHHSTCKEHVDYFVVMSKVSGLSMSEALDAATNVYVPRTVSEVFHRLENGTL